MDARRLELYEMLKPTLGEQPARALVLALGPPPENIATKDYIDGRFAATKDYIEARFAQADARFERLENVLTRRMVAILGTWTVLVASAFAWAGALLR